MYFVVLRNGYPLASLESPAMEVGMLLGVREVLKLRNVEFPILPDKGEDGERIVFKLIAFGCSQCCDIWMANQEIRPYRRIPTLSM